MLLGKITETVESLGLANNTLMYFTSDHGGHIEDADSTIGQKGGWNGIYKGRRQRTLVTHSYTMRTCLLLHSLLCGVYLNPLPL